uniref:Peroxisomal ATPase PEX1 n=1 Tax=Callorhinchus milii TaxID=7868 RepID=A0A4W3J9M4_CALMI
CVLYINCQTIELSWGLQQSAYLSWVGRRYGGFKEENIVEINRQLGEKLGIKDGEQVFLRPCSQISSCHQAVVEPLSPDDWEILELHSASLERHIMDQIRVVFPGGVFPIWVEKRTVIYIKIVSISPAAAYGRLERFTELIVSPKLRHAEGGSLQASFDESSIFTKKLNSDNTQMLHDNFERAENEHLLKRPNDKYTIHDQYMKENQDISNKNILSYLWGFLKDIFSGNLDVSEKFPSKDAFLSTVSNSVEMDSIFRVCKQLSYKLKAPGSILLNQSQPDTVHVFPLNPYVPNMGSNKVIYGKLTKLLSYREAKEKTKQSPQIEKKAGSNGDIRTSKTRTEGEHEACIVKVIIHGCEDFKCVNSSTGFHNGKVWIPDGLRKKLNLEVSAAVRINSVKPDPAFPTGLKLQPLQILPPGIKEDDIKSSFITWLNIVSSGHLPLFTSWSSLIQIPVNECKGVCELATSAFEHISHSLLGCPLSRDMSPVVLGLRNGALLLTGIKGSGKSTLAKTICRDAADKLEAYVEIIDCKTLRGKRAENIRKKWEEAFAEAMWRQPSILLFDDLDDIACAASTPEHEHSPEAILSKQLVQILKDLIAEAISQGSLIALIATSISEYTLHPSLVSAQGSHIFQRFQEISPPDQDQRVQLLSSVIQNKTNVAVETLQNIDLQRLAKETEGYVARDFVMLVDRAMHSHVLTSKNSIQRELHLTMSDFQQAFKGFTPTSLRNANLHKPKDVGWDKVGGLHEVKQMLIDTIQLSVKYPHLFAKLPIRQRSGILLYGGPGTGKTLLAAAIARESGMNFISIKGPELLSKYIGASEQAVRDVFSRSQAAKPCILFFDEFDSIAPRRGHDNTGVTDRVVNQLLTQLDGVEALQGVYVLAATSRPDLIDPALLRPGRLDKSVYCPPPDQIARLEILKALSQSLPLADDIDFQQLAAMTEYFTGADLKALLYNAQLDAVHSALSSSVFRDTSSGSDSDMSLSSMIFLNPNSGSDDSLGDVEGGFEHSLVHLDTTDLLSDDPGPNIWRFYFGSSYESELGNGTPSEPTSRCLSEPSSVTHDHMVTSVKDIICSHPPVCMLSLQEGFKELNQEQMECLRSELNIIKANTRNKTTVIESLLNQSGPINSPPLVSQSHLLAALTNTRPSISQQDWRNFTELKLSNLCFKESTLPTSVPWDVLLT